MKKYRKTLVAVGAFCAVLGRVLADGEVNAQEGLELFVAALAAFGVYQIPNDQS